MLAFKPPQNPQIPPHPVSHTKLNIGSLLFHTSLRANCLYFAILSLSQSGSAVGGGIIRVRANWSYLAALSLSQSGCAVEPLYVNTPPPPAPPRGLSDRGQTPPPQPVFYSKLNIGSLLFHIPLVENACFQAPTESTDTSPPCVSHQVEHRVVTFPHLSAGKLLVFCDTFALPEWVCSGWWNYPSAGKLLVFIRPRANTTPPTCILP